MLPCILPFCVCRFVGSLPVTMADDGRFLMIIIYDEFIRKRIKGSLRYWQALDRLVQTA